MTRRISRRTQDDLVIHKWWFNGVLALVLLAVASFLLTLARDSHSLAEYILAIILIAGGLNRAVRGLRHVSDL